MLMPALPHTAGKARQYVRWLLNAWKLPSMVETVELLVSELVANAINATGVTEVPEDINRLVGKAQPIYVCISVRPEAVLIEVWDSSSTLPLQRAAADDEENGRGLVLVQALSKEWGCVLLPTGGKIVWCECLIEGSA
ncbi:ATP-binding protein [Actinoallomurus soli]|uniref:ATP-binding protein n=1 Tax=Actinoallomurus soli TaxID=2952535 RepID=UPI002093A862|nr:ATP-binding protein [Actinoallomurus soli]MCO5968251.1 ATP-binding protein [Actinoallomurus soli]